jgi:non-ribosomal peptide synthase protein (TIGR01720 family)
VLTVPAELDQPSLVTAVQALLDHHDALRMSTDGTAIAEPGTVDAAGLVHRVDVAELPPLALAATVATEAAAARHRLSPRDGVTAQVVWFDAGPAAGRLLVMLHHFVVDAVSWHVLLPDLRIAWEAAVAGRTPVLDPVGTSLRGWATTVAELAGSPDRLAELPDWQRLLGAPEQPLGRRPLDPVRDTAATVRELSLVLPAEPTTALLETVPGTLRASVNDVLLTGLAVALDRCGRTGGTLVDLEGHGREELTPGMDLSRTVGWFTKVHPVRIDAGGQNAGRAVKLVKEQLRAVPGDGHGYGLLRYLNPSTAPALAAGPAPQIGFNYLGRAAGGGAGGMWSPAPEAPAIAPRDPQMPAVHALDLNAVAVDRGSGPELHANWSWPAGLLDAGWVERLAESWFEALRAIVAHAALPGASALTPSDLSLELDQDEIESLEAELGILL